ncbi:MAG: NAD(P)H-dependent oxidoreductase subunit E [Deltaproteobacteria bacterium]|nr:NAD(P)H-dependent oxidoreductase subunit E [Deltaproteobacteria bacterium]
MGLSQEADRKIEEIKAKYPNARSAIMPALYMAQEELGHLTGDAIAWVADKVGVSPAHVMEVATFYTMYYKHPVGKYHFQVCRTLSCAIRGAKELTKHLHQKFGILPHEVSGDGMWSYEEVECLGSCGTAPMCEINDVYFENLTPEKLEEIIKELEATQPDIRYSTLKDAIGAGMKNTRSEVI